MISFRLLTLFSFSFLFNIAASYTVPHFIIGESKEKFSLSSKQESIEGVSMPRWLWNGKLNFKSDPLLNQWRRLSSDNEVVFQFIYSDTCFIRIWTANTDKSTLETESKIENHWNSFLNLLAKNAENIELIESSEFQGNRPIIGYMPMCFHMSYRIIEKDNIGELMERYIYISPDLNSAHLLIITLEGPSKIVEYCRNDFEKWTSSFALTNN